VRGDALERCLACEADGEQGENQRHVLVLVRALSVDDGPYRFLRKKVHLFMPLDRAQAIALLSHAAHHRPRKRGSAPRLAPFARFTPIR
jgi:hypothetical protein